MSHIVWALPWYLIGIFIDILEMRTTLARLRKGHGPSAVPFVALFFYWGPLLWGILRLKPLGLPGLAAATLLTLFNIVSNYVIPVAYGRWWNGRTPLHRAVISGKLEKVKRLIGSDANVNASDNRGWTPLHLAVETSNREMLSLLLDLGADANAMADGGRTGLAMAAWNRSRDIVQELVAAGADPRLKSGQYQCAIESAIWEDHLDVLKFLLANSRDLDVDGADGSDWLRTAVLRSRVEIAKYLINMGAKLDLTRLEFQNGTLLHSILSYGGVDEAHRVKMADLLIGMGVDINARNSLGWTALRLARALGRKEVARALISHGARE